MCVKLGRYLQPGEEVDHIDNDKTNDSIDNLQILTGEENIRKYRDTLPPPQHGHSAMIKAGCKCDVCRAARRRWNLQYSAKHKAETKRKTDTEINDHCGVEESESSPSS